MATAIYPLRKVQYGLETQAGTLVAADAQLVAEGTYTPSRTIETSDFPRIKTPGFRLRFLAGPSRRVRLLRRRLR